MQDLLKIWNISIDEYELGNWGASAGLKFIPQNSAAMRFKIENDTNEKGEIFYDEEACFKEIAINIITIIKTNKPILNSINPSSQDVKTKKNILRASTIEDLKKAIYSGIMHMCENKEAWEMTLQNSLSTPNFNIGSSPTPWVLFSNMLGKIAWAHLENSDIDSYELNEKTGEVIYKGAVGNEYFITHPKIIEELREETNKLIKNNKIKDKGITNKKLADEAVDSRVLKDGSVTAEKLDDEVLDIDDNAIDTNNIKDDAITTTKIKDQSITELKLSDPVRVKLNSKGNGDGNQSGGILIFQGGNVPNDTTFKKNVDIEGKLTNSQLEGLANKLAIHRSNLGIKEKTYLHDFSSIGISDSRLKELWLSSPDNKDRIYGVLNSVFVNMKKSNLNELILYGKIQHGGGYLFTTIWPSELQRVGGYFINAQIQKSKIWIFHFGTDDRIRDENIFEAISIDTKKDVDKNSPSYYKHFEDKQDIKTGNWDNPFFYTATPTMDSDLLKSFLKHETLDQDETYITDFEKKDVSLHTWFEEEFAYHQNQSQFKEGVEYLLVSSKNLPDTDVYDRKDGDENTWLVPKALKLESKNGTGIDYNLTTGILTLAKGVYYIEYNQLIYDCDTNGLILQEINLDNLVKGTDYHITHDSNNIIGFYNPGSGGNNQNINAKTFAKLKILNDSKKNIVLRFKQPDTARPSGWGHKQAELQSHKQNWIYVVKLDSGEERD